MRQAEIGNLITLKSEVMKPQHRVTDIDWHNEERIVCYVDQNGLGRYAYPDQIREVI